MLRLSWTILLASLVLAGCKRPGASEPEKPKTVETKLTPAQKYAGLLQRGHELLAAGELNQAFKLAFQATRSNEARFEAWLLGSMIMSQAGDLDKAKEFLAKAGQRAPEDKKLLVSEFEAVIAEASKQKKLQDAVNEVVARADDARARNRHALAAKTYVEAWEMDPTRSALALRAASSLLTLEEFAPAAGLLRRLLAGQPEKAAATQARETLERLRPILEKHYEREFAAGKTALAGQDYDLAEKAFARAIAALPDEGVAYFERARALAARGKIAAAVVAIDDAVRHGFLDKTRFVETEELRPLLLHDKYQELVENTFGAKVKARLVARAEQDAGMAEKEAKAARALSERRWSTAIALFEQLISAGGDSDSVRRQLAQAYIGQAELSLFRNSSEAVTWCAKAEKLGSTDRRLDWIRARALVRKNDYKGALPLLQRSAARFGTEQPLIFADRSTCHSKLGMPDLAAKDYATYVELLERSGTTPAKPVFVNLGNLWNTAKDYEQAVRAYDRALAISVDGTTLYYRSIVKRSLGDSKGASADEREARVHLAKEVLDTSLHGGTRCQRYQSLAEIEARLGYTETSTRSYLRGASLGLAVGWKSTPLTMSQRAYGTAKTEGEKAWAKMCQWLCYKRQKNWTEAKKARNEADRLIANARKQGRSDRAFAYMALVVADREAGDLANLAASLNTAAWILATSKGSSQRNGAWALELSTESVNHTRKLVPANKVPADRLPMYLDTLAAAYAEVGRFDVAAKHQAEALELVSSPQRGSYETRLTQYLSNQAHRTDN